MRSTLSLLVFLSFACGDDDSVVDVGTDSGTDAGSDARDGGTDAGIDAGPVCVGSEVVTFDTSDGVTLEADLHLAGESRGIAILFHMIPPSNTRANYPDAFVEALVARGVNVLNVDRRGAGGSGGVATEAYEGPGGALDVEAAVAFADAHACAFDLERLTLVGASNGTTSVFDYVVAASDNVDAAAPKAVVWLTPGTYTENQHTFADKRGILESTPLLFVWTPTEAPAEAWIAPLREGAPGDWAFQDYAAGDHGTATFGSAPESVEAVATWIADNAG